MSPATWTPTELESKSFILASEVWRCISPESKRPLINLVGSPNEVELLEELLVGYEGTLLLVSHDRAFLDNVVTSTLVFEGGGRITEYTGGYEDWIRQRPDPADVMVQSVDFTPAPTMAKSVKSIKTRKFLNREQKELEALPKTIETLETRQAEVLRRLADPALYQGKNGEFQRFEKELHELNSSIETSMARWEELEALRLALASQCDNL